MTDDGDARKDDRLYAFKILPPVIAAGEINTANFLRYYCITDLDIVNVVFVCLELLAILRTSTTMDYKRYCGKSANKRKSLCLYMSYG